jgi:hypothetical protein
MNGNMLFLAKYLGFIFTKSKTTIACLFKFNIKSCQSENLSITQNPKIMELAFALSFVKFYAPC